MKHPSKALFVCGKGFSPSALMVAITPYLNREVYALETKRRENGKTGVYLRLKADKKNRHVGPDMINKEDFYRRVIAAANNKIQDLSAKLMVQIDMNDQLSRKVLADKAKVQAYGKVKNMLEFISGIGPEAVEGISSVVDYAKKAGFLDDFIPSKEVAKNGKL